MSVWIGAACGAEGGNVNDLIQLPCDCVVDVGAIIVDPKHRDILECPWCSSTFDGAELCDWYGEAQRAAILRPKPLISCGNLLFEVVAECDCGAPLVRPRGMVKAKPACLKVPAQFVQVLRD